MSNTRNKLEIHFLISPNSLGKRSMNSNVPYKLLLLTTNKSKEGMNLDLLVMHLMGVELK